MTKKEVQKRILQHGKPLAMHKYSWIGKTRTLSTGEGNLVIDARDVGSCTITAGHYCTITADWHSVITAGHHSAITVGGYSTITAGWYCTIAAGDNSICSARESCRWVVDGVMYDHPPLYLPGPQYNLHVNRPGSVSIGCETHTFDEWDNDIETIARVYNHGDLVAVYRDLLEVARLWAGKRDGCTIDADCREEKACDNDEIY